ncbi:hypothetical protein KLP40_04795 [Hymenobacter sp. NST-14]|uniref:hypothetical protein n=1 Tax=Hymenobacter piscis TaxID=2839984 RepID=UPI001C02B677|nr:hypothetical protein [Hymenobacter piscis]MBT9392473.1 hypothetical protein [Hymenobacter piscis]
MLFRFSLSGPALAAVLLGLSACNDSPSSRAAATSGAPPFVAADGTPVGAPGGQSVATQATAPTAPSGAPLPDSLHLVSPGQAGRLKLGMSEARLRELVPAARLRATTYQDQGRTLPAYELLDAARPDAPATVLHLMAAPGGGWQVRRIRILDPQYRTAEGIGVGSPFGAARQNLGLTRIRNTPAGLAAVSGEVQMAWVIDPNSLPPRPPENMESADIPPAARITAILLYR